MRALFKTSCVDEPAGYTAKAECARPRAQHGAIVLTRSSFPGLASLFTFPARSGTGIRLRQAYGGQAGALRRSCFPFACILLGAALLLTTPRCRGDATIVIQGPNGPVRITSTGTIKITPANQQSPETNDDFFNSMISSAASVDMDSPVTARAEFDPPVVPAGGRATYRIVINALDESLKAPDTLPAPAGLTVTAGGRAQTYQMVGGGRLQPQTTLNFRAVAASNGVYSMPSFTLLAYGKAVPVPEAQLVVVPAGTPGVREAPHLVLKLPPGNIYVGQTLTFPVMLTDPGDGSAQGFSQVRINGDGFFSERMPAGVRRESIQGDDGRTYAVFAEDVTITPMREGPQTVVAQADSNRLIPGQPGGFSSALVDSDQMVIDVKPLPMDGRLPGFTGAVGVFQVDPPRLSTNQVRAGDPVTLAVVVRGDGSLGRLIPPQVPLQREWQTFPPVSDNAPPFIVQQRGFAAFQYTLIPLTAQARSTPPIPFSCFDPKTGAYLNLTIPPMPLTVTGSPAALEPAADESAESGGPLALTGLAETPGLGAGTLVALQQRGWFLAGQLLPAALLIGFWAWDRRRRRLERHPEIIRKYLARRGLRRQLKLARHAAETQDAAGFVTNAVSALREASAPHGAANPDALVCGDVLAELPPAGRQGKEAEVVRRLFAAADAARFGGAVADGPELLALKTDWERVLDRLKARL
jgi:hypothetical protein